MRHCTSRRCLKVCLAFTALVLVLAFAGCQQKPAEIDGLKLGMNRVLHVNHIHVGSMLFEGHEPYQLTVPEWAFHGQEPAYQYSRSATWVMVGPGKMARWLRGADDTMACPGCEPCDEPMPLFPADCNNTTLPESTDNCWGFVVQAEFCNDLLRAMFGLDNNTDPLSVLTQGMVNSASTPANAGNPQQNWPNNPVLKDIGIRGHP